MSEKPLDDVRLSLTTEQVVSDALDHLGEVTRALAADRVCLHVVVEQFDRFKLRCVAGQEVKLDPLSVLGDPRLDEL